MTKGAVLKAIKEANIIVDRMAIYPKDSKTYADLSEALYWTLDCLTGHNWFTLQLSKRTGHYYVTF